MTPCNPAPPAKTNTTDCDEQTNHQDLSRLPSDTSTKIECSEESDDTEFNPILSRKRWSILFAVSIFGFCITVTNDTSPILDQILRLLDLEVTSYVYIGQIFTFLMSVLAVPSAMFLDVFDIRATVLTAACFFVLSGTFQTLLYFTDLPGWSHYKMCFYILGRILGTQCFAMFFLLPLKVSETWFPESERTTAWMIMFLQMEIGVCFVSYLSPRLIIEISDFRLLGYVTIGAVSVAMITCVALVTRSEPPNPPSKRAASKDIAPIGVSLKRVARQKDILMHMFHSSFFTAMNQSMASVLQNMLSSIGYSQIFAGNYMLINAFFSSIMSVIMASFVHRIHNATLACKLGSFLQAAQFSVLLLAIWKPFPGWAIITISIILTCARSWTVPNFNNMTAHLASGVVSQPVTIGISLAITPFIMTIVQVTFAYLIETHNKTSSYHNSLLFLMGINLFNEAVYQLFFHGKSSPRSDDAVHIVESEDIENDATIADRS